MKRLLIVESPAKTKTIAKFLGNDVKVMSTVGHVKDLPQREIGVAINGEIALTYVVIENKEKTIAELCKAAQNVQEVYLAPDPDREGEIIAWHVAQELSKVIKKSTTMYRITFNEITKSAVEEALAHPAAINEHRVAAQQARRVLDRWVGYEVSPVLWRKLSKGLSAGRVQSVALRLICMREDEIRNFKPEEYWTIHLLFTAPAEGKDGKPATCIAQLTHINKKKAELPNTEAAEAAIAKVKAANFSIESIKDSKRARAPYAPFMTSTLQQAAYNQLGFSVQKTMQIAQKLYEGIPLGGDPVALITYMRTDSLRIADSALTAVRSYIKKKIGDDYLPAKANLYSKSNAQDAHEAIRPIDVSVAPEAIAAHASSDEAALYGLIWRRFVACQMKPAQYAQRVVTIQGGSCTAKVSGSTLLFDGFLKVYEERESDEAEDETKVKIPASLAEGMPLELSNATPKQHFTQAPPRYTEASLVKELEKEGIGRPSTYATIMKTIQQRSYTTLDQKKRFVPTELGMAVTKMLVEHLPRIMDIKFTAHMEEDLDRIEQGAAQRDTILREFYEIFMQELAEFRGEATRKPTEPAGIPCPQCGADLLIRFGKSGPFVGCSKFPECGFTSNFERDTEGKVVLVAQQKPQMLSETCPQCGKPLREIVGRFGKFIACSGYPECKYIQQEKAPFACPQCGSEVTKRSWKGKFFWGCTGYPKCTFTKPYDNKPAE